MLCTQFQQWVCITWLPSAAPASTSAATPDAAAAAAACPDHVGRGFRRYLGPAAPVDGPADRAEPYDLQPGSVGCSSGPGERGPARCHGPAFSAGRCLHVPAVRAVLPAAAPGPSYPERLGVADRPVSLRIPHGESSPILILNINVVWCRTLGFSRFGIFPVRKIPAGDLWFYLTLYSIIIYNI